MASSGARGVSTEPKLSKRLFSQVNVLPVLFTISHDVGSGRSSYKRGNEAWLSRTLFFHVAMISLAVSFCIRLQSKYRLVRRVPQPKHSIML